MDERDDGYIRPRHWARERCLTELGEPAGAHEVEGAVASWRGSGETIGLPIFTVMLAEAYLLAGRIEAAQAALAEPLLTGREAAEGWVEPLLHCVRAEIALAAGAPGALGALERAAAFAGARGARLMESRALARLDRSVAISQDPGPPGGTAALA